MSFIGTGSYIEFASGFFAKIMDITPPGMSRESIQSSHMLTPDAAHTFLPAKLVDFGEMTVEMQFDPDVFPPIDQDPEEITIHFPDSGGTTWTFDGFMTGYEPSDPLEDLMVATATIKVTGRVSI